MEQKILKLSFPAKEDWEKVKVTLQETAEDTVNWKVGIKSVNELRHMQKPPAADWVPDPENPDDNGWSVYPDWAVDIVVEAGFDYTDLKQYLIKEPKRVGHIVNGFVGEIVYKHKINKV